MADTADFLAVDLGASGGRVLLGSWDGRRFELQELHRFPNGSVRIHDALHWDILRLWQETQAGLATYAARYRASPASIGVDSWAVDFGLLDGHGRLLGNPFHYRDSRTDGVASSVFAKRSWPDIFAITGIQFLPFNSLYQLASMVNARDPQLAAAETLLLIPDLLGYWLTGRKVAEYSNATTTQMLDCRSRSWATALLDDLGVPTALLPPLVQPGTVLGELHPAVVAATGLRDDVRVVVPGTHDTASAVAAVPGLDDRSAYISSGTWSLVGLELPAPVVNADALAGNITNEGGVGGTIRLLKNVTGLWLLQECQRQWQRAGEQHTWEQLVALAGATPPLGSLVDPDAADFLHPSDMPAAIRRFCRRHGEFEPTSIGAIVRCCLESVALKYRHVLDLLEQLTGRHIETIRVVGGGSQNRLLCQFTADACRRPVVAGPVEATALGNIVVQAIATGYLPDLAAGRQAVSASVTLQHYAPDWASVGRWDDAFSRFNALLSQPDDA